MLTLAARRRPAATLVLSLLLFGTSAAAGAQQLYRYVDVDGRVVYSDKPPPANAREAQTKRISKNTIDTGSLSYAAAQAQERFPVTLYTFNCGVVCDTAAGVLNKRGVPHTVIDVSQNAGAEKLKRLAGNLDAPALQVGDQVLSGFNENRWQTVLTDAGYPKTPPPRTTPVARVAPPATAAAQNQAPEAAPKEAAKAEAPPKGSGYPQ